MTGLLQGQTQELARRWPTTIVIIALSLFNFKTPINLQNTEPKVTKLVIIIK